MADIHTEKQHPIHAGCDTEESYGPSGLCEDFRMRGTKLRFFSLKPATLTDWAILGHMYVCMYVLRTHGEGSLNFTKFTRAHVFHFSFSRDEVAILIILFAINTCCRPFVQVPYPGYEKYQNTLCGGRTDRPTSTRQLSVTDALQIALWPERVN